MVRGFWSRKFAVATIAACAASGIVAVPTAPFISVPVAEAVEKLDEADGDVDLSASTGSINQQRDWRATVRLGTGDYEERTFRAVRIYFLAAGGQRKSFPSNAEYEVKLTHGTTVLKDLGTVTGYGSADSEGSRWLDLTLPEDVILRDGDTLFVDKVGGAGILPERGYGTAQGAGAMGFKDRIDGAAIQGNVAFNILEERFPKGLGVSLLDGSGETLQTTETDEDGRYEFEAVEPGNYTVKFNAVPGYLAPESVTIAANTPGTYRQDVDELTPITAVGRVVDANGDGVEGIKPYIDVGSGNEISAVTDSDGKFTLSAVPAGTHVLNIDASEDHGTVDVSQSVKIEEVEKNQLKPVRVQSKFGSLVGTVVDPDGNPISDVPVALNRDNDTVLTTTTSSDGTFSFPHVPRGIYEVVFSSTAHVGGREQGVEVRSDKTVDLGLQTLNFVKGAIYGRVVGEQDDPVENAIVSIWKRGSDDAGVRATVDSDGRFSVGGLEPGLYDVTVEANGFLPKTRVVDVQPAESATAAFWLTPKPKPQPTPTTAPKPSPTSTKPTPTSAKPQPAPTTSKVPPKPKPPATSKPKPTVTPKPKPPATSKPKPKPPVKPKPAPAKHLTWDALAVAPGEVTSVKPSTAVDKAITFKDLTVQRDGLAVNGTDWATIDAQGKVTVAPPEYVTPGKYEVQVSNSTGATDTIALTVGEPASLSSLYKVTYEPRIVRAGDTAISNKPVALRTIGPKKYEWQPLPKGTTFKIVKTPGATVDTDGRVRYEAPADAQPGETVTAKVLVTFPDGSTHTVGAPFEITEGSMAQATAPQYETGVLVGPRQTTQLRITNADTQPEGTEYVIGKNPELKAWAVSLDPVSGALTASAPGKAQPVAVPVEARYPDGSTREIVAKIGVAKAVAPKKNAVPTFADSVAKIGSAVNTAPTRSAPSGTEYFLEDDAGLQVAVDKRTGRVTAKVPDDAPAAAVYTVKVRAKYPDGSEAILPVKVVTNSQARQQEDAAKASPSTAPKAPKGTTYGIAADFAEPGWSVSVDKQTGELTATVDANIASTASIVVPRVVTYPDGSQRTENITVRAKESTKRAPAAQPQKQSSAATWVPIVLGVLAALGGAAYAAYLNQDHIRRILSQFGIRI